jgi:hypothetical protein
MGVHLLHEVQIEININYKIVVLKPINSIPTPC